MGSIVPISRLSISIERSRILLRLHSRTPFLFLKPRPSPRSQALSFSRSLRFVFLIFGSRPHHPLHSINFDHLGAGYTVPIRAARERAIPGSYWSRKSRLSLSSRKVGLKYYYYLPIRIAGFCFPSFLCTACLVSDLRTPGARAEL